MDCGAQNRHDAYNTANARLDDVIDNTKNTFGTKEN
jgi:hypothetical protein